jgi:hypothetical protein
MGAPGTTRGGPTARSREGQNLLELALLMPLLALIMLGATDLARVFIAHTRLTDAVMAGAVYAGHFPDKKSAIITRAYNSAGGRLGVPNTDFVIDAASGIRCYEGQTTTLIASTPAGDCTAKDANNVLIVGPGDTVEITASYAFKPITGQIIRLLGSDYRIRARVRMVIQ